MWRNKDTQIQEAQRVPNNLDPKRPTLRHIIIKMMRLKDKETILKAAREKQVPHLAVYNVPFFAQIFQGKVRMPIVCG